MCVCGSGLFLKERADSPLSQYFIPAGKVQPNEWVRLTHKACNYPEVGLKLCLMPAPSALWTVYLFLWHHQHLPCHPVCEGELKALLWDRIKHTPQEYTRKLPSHYGDLTNRLLVCCGRSVLNFSSGSHAAMMIIAEASLAPDLLQPFSIVKIADSQVIN